MRHPTTRAERLTLRRRHSGDRWAERSLGYKYRFRRMFGLVTDRAYRDKQARRDLWGFWDSVLGEEKPRRKT